MAKLSETEERLDRLTAILDSLPAHIALLDAQGTIVSVNETWKQFARSHALVDQNLGTGLNYLEVCDRVRGEGAEDAQRAAGGIRAVLSGDLESHSLEYPCGLPGDMRWFQFTVTPLSTGDRRSGAVVMHMDITDRKEAEESLDALSATTEQRERMLSTLLSSTTDFAYILDRDCRFLFVNQPLLDLWGITLEQAIGKSFLELGFPPELAGLLEKQVKQAFATRKSISDETAYTSPSGHTGFYEYIFTPVEASDGIVEVVVGSTRDITERMRSERALRDSDEKFRQLADNITDVFWIRSPDMSEVHYLSPGFERIWGRTRETLTGKPEQWVAFVVPEDRDFAQHEFERLRADARSIELEYRIARPDGEIRWVFVRGFQVRDTAGALIRIIGIVTDITERKRIEMALRESEREQRQLAERLEIKRSRLDAAQRVAKMGSWETDVATMDVIWSDETHRIFGTDSSTFRPTHQRFLDRVHPDDRLFVDEAFRRSLAEDSASVVEHRVLLPDGHIKFVEERWQVLHDQGQPIRASGTCQDITERRNSETEYEHMAAQLRQAQKMEAVGQLAAGVAHEFNNLLQALMSMATIARLRATDQEIAKLGSEMETQIKRGAGLTQQLLQFSRQHPLEKTDLDIREHIERASGLLHHLLPENIRIVVKISSEPLSIEGDAGQIQQVLLNLAINARDAMPDGGTLTLRAGRIQRDVFLEVEDTGQGMDEATEARIFEPFFTTKETGKGTGLGLAVAYGIVKHHGGRIEVESAPGQGSRFRVLIPAVLRETLRAPQETVESSPAVAEIGRVFLVEDEESVREALTMLLGMMGYEVIAAGSAEEALVTPMVVPPDILLSDVTLPGLTGFDLGEQLSRRWPSMHVVLMSGYIGGSRSQSTMNADWQFLQKPFEIAELTDKLAQARAGKPRDSAGL